jgi:hypothetical protein
VSFWRFQALWASEHLLWVFFSKVLFFFKNKEIVNKSIKKWGNSIKIVIFRVCVSCRLLKFHDLAVLKKTCFKNEIYLLRLCSLSVLMWILFYVRDMKCWVTFHFINCRCLCDLFYFLSLFGFFAIQCKHTALIKQKNETELIMKNKSKFVDWFVRFELSS